MYEELFTAIKEASLPAIWSRAVELSRSARIVRTASSDDEISLKVIVDRRPVANRVTLWSDDGAWSCDCDESADPCTHVIASLIALRSGKVEEDSPQAEKPSSGARLVYAFERFEGRVLFFRYIDSPAGREKLRTNLLGYIGGVSSGRLRGPQVGATKRDTGIDSLLGDLRDAQPDRETIPALFRQLSGLPNIELDRTPVSVESDPVTLRLVIEDTEGGIVVKRGFSQHVDESFKNGIVRSGGILKLLDIPVLSESERRYLLPEGALIRNHDIPRFAVEQLPSLSAKLQTEIRSKRLPELKRMPPRIVIDTVPDAGGNALLVTPRLVYGDGDEEVSISQGQMFAASGNFKVVPIRDEGEERRLLRDLRMELDLQPDRTIRLEPKEAITFVRDTQGWTLRGEGVGHFSLYGVLSIAPEIHDGRFEVFGEVSGPGSERKRARFSDIVASWQQKERTVRLLDGGFAVLPSDWLERFGPRLIELHQARNSEGVLPPALVPSAGRLFDDLGISVPDAVAEMRKRLLERKDSVRTFALPAGFRGTLRSYQHEGVAWLASLRELGFGALLADDMGLGKTVQTVAAIEAGTLVVAPTSVIHSWIDHLRRFRPDLSFNLYRGPGRSLDGGADVTVTSYGVLRLDAEKLTERQWSMVILDEAQAIKNSESQTAQSAHRLRAAGRIALTGTPVENHLGELWSLFNFLNPGLLGTADHFHERFLQPISKGDVGLREELAARLRPFILRRTKSEVAPELPPKTELVVRCDLSAEERSMYDTLLFSTRAEIKSLLEQGGSLFSALEQLLRLRQLCCHPSLVPGMELQTPGAKLTLLRELLECAVDEGHRALVFSQWTSLLDLVEPLLRESSIDFLRLDGSTQDRASVVNRFQGDDGPPVMLLSLKAGGTGLTLTAADHVFLLDPWWNPAVENQAADRTHRIGQENPVMVYRMIVEDTIEEKILELQETKRALLDAVLEGTGSAASLSKEDLLRLLEE